MVRSKLCSYTEYRRLHFLIPTCIVTCSEPKDPTDGFVEYSGLSVGSLAEYNCSEGFLLVGVTTRVCQTNGTWSEDVPMCLGGEINV